MARKYDANGNEIIEGPPLPGVVAPIQQSRTYDSDRNEIDYAAIEKKTGPQLKSDSTGGRLSRSFLSALPTITGTLGGLAGGPLGSAGGALVGSGIANAPGLINQDTRKDAVLNMLGDTAFQGLTEGAAPFISKGLARSKDFLVNKLIRSFPVHGDPAPLLQSGLPFSVGQATKSPIAIAGERLFGKEDTRVALQKEQESGIQNIIDKLRVTFTSNKTPVSQPEQEFGTLGKMHLRENKVALQDEINTAFKKVEFDAKVNTQKFPVKTGEAPTGITDPNTNQMTMRPIYETKTIEGPIEYPRTGVMIAQIKPEIDAIFDTLPQGDPLKSNFGRFKRVLDELSVPQDTPNGPKFIAEWRMIKQFRTDLNRAVGSLIDPTRGEAGLKAIAGVLGKDVEESVVRDWEQKTPGALNRLLDANAKNTAFADTFNQRVKSAFQVKGGVRPDPSKVFKLAETNPDAAQEMVRALGPNDQRPIKAHFFEQLMKKADGNAGSALDLLDTSSYKRIFTSPERADLSNAFKTIDRIKPDTSQAGTFSVAFKAYGVAIGLGALGGELGNELISGDSKFRIPSGLIGGASLFIGSRVFAEKVLLNTRYARAATRLAKLAPDSDEAIYLRKTILTALRGTNLTFKLANGDEKQASITPSGKIKLQDQ